MKRNTARGFALIKSSSRVTGIFLAFNIAQKHYSKCSRLCLCTSNREIRKLTPLIETAEFHHIKFRAHYAAHVAN